MDEPQTKQCWECRRRRLVCDYTRPTCRKCGVRGVACPGYDGKRPLRWLRPQQVNAKGPEKAVVPRTVKPSAERHSMSAVLEAIEYYNVHIAPDLVATGTTGPQSPYWMPHFTVPFLPRAFIESIVCTALCHRILQSSDAPRSDQVVLARRLQRHRGDALRALNEDLGQRPQQSDVTLASVILLLLVEIQQSFDPPNWRHHANGAAVMINMKGGLGVLVLSRPHLRHLFRYYALIEIMGNTTSPDVDADSARHHLELVTMLPVLFGKGLSTCFPCPPELLAEIMLINHLRSVFRSVSSPTDTNSVLLREGKHSAALDILRRVKAFKTGTWAAEVAIDLSSSQDAAGLSGWQAIACIFQSAIAVYCIASLCGEAEAAQDDRSADSQSSPRGALTKAREACRVILFDKLREASKSMQLRKQVIWPLFVAGVEAEDETTRRFIVTELRWISNALGTAAPLVAKDLLENRVWRLRLGKGGWDNLFDRSYVFVL